MVKFRPDMAVFPIYIIVLAMIIFFLGSLWELSIVLMLMLAITVIHKILTDRELSQAKKSREKIIDIITEKLEVFSMGIESVRQDIAERYKDFDLRTATIEKNYTDLTTRVIDIENRVHEVRKTLGAAVGSLEERLNEKE